MKISMITFSVILCFLSTSTFAEMYKCQANNCNGLFYKFSILLNDDQIKDATFYPSKDLKKMISFNKPITFGKEKNQITMVSKKIYKLPNSISLELGDSQDRYGFALLMSTDSEGFGVASLINFEGSNRVACTYTCTYSNVVK